MNHPLIYVSNLTPLFTIDPPRQHIDDSLKLPYVGHSFHQDMLLVITEEGKWEFYNEWSAVYIVRLLDDSTGEVCDDQEWLMKMKQRNEEGRIKIVHWATSTALFSQYVKALYSEVLT